MRVALLADVHSNLEALTACLAHARRQSAERFVFLGDLLGYNADPLACLEIVGALAGGGATVLRGNHDEACLGGLCEDVNFHARDAIYWTRERLGAAERAFLDGLPLVAADAVSTYAHASPHEPQRWTYITGAREAAQALAAAKTPLVAVGHVHHAALYYTGSGGTPRRFDPVPGVPIPFGSRRRWLLIAGSVGQPRDGNTAASYAMLDQQRSTVTSFRVPYDYESAARKVRAAGLPLRLARRLESGR
jgi:diadenosine tetraphosphatase ApaH/serine/threonine PP2A family protein phosphatase